MRDIRTDLRERLAAVAGRYSDEVDEYDRKRTALEASHKSTLEALARERAALEQLLAIEDQRAGIPTATLAQKLAILVPLADFLIAKVQAHGLLEKDELRAAASLAGYMLPDGSGRSFHITLMNITKSGRLVLRPDGRYALPERAPANLFAASNSELEGNIQTAP